MLNVLSNCRAPMHSAMELRTQETKEIFELLKENISNRAKDDGMTPTILLGEKGVGKTWMAKKISNLAKRNDLIYHTLWICLNKKYDRRSLHESIYQELALLSSNTKWEDDDGEEKQESLERLKQKISEKLEEMVSKSENIYFLVVLDDSPCGKDEEDMISQLNNMRKMHERCFFEVLVTRGESGDQTPIEGSKKETQISRTRVYRIGPLSNEDSRKLLKERVRSSEHCELLSNGIEGMNICNPGLIIMIADALNCIVKYDFRILSRLSIMEESAYGGKAAFQITQLLQSWYDMLPSSYMIDCCWHSIKFFQNHAGVHYNELITRWILEGYMGHIDQVKEAYHQGYSVLMELIDRGMLRKQENDIVNGYGQVLNVTDHCRSRSTGFSCLGLVNVFKDFEWEGFGKIALTDGMIKSLCRGQSSEKVSTVLVDGRQLCREGIETFFQCMQGLKIFAIFNPRFGSLPFPMSMMKKLIVLVLRGCDLLENIDNLRGFFYLSVLEISGATSLEVIPADLFKDMPNLQSVNLSGSKVKFLPPSLFSLSELRWLIVRGCSYLETLPSLKALRELEVIDLSGAVSLTTLQDISFASLQKMQTIDLSQSRINCLPDLHGLGELTHLILKGCQCLLRLPTLVGLHRIEVIDLSGAKSLKKIEDSSLEKNYNLKVLDLSGTAVSQLPAKMGKLTEIYWRNCSLLEKLPMTDTIEGLEVLDVYGARKFVEIEDKSFSHRKFLRILNFSRTKVERLPSLTNLSNLCELLLRDCLLLRELPEMEGLKGLQTLDVSGCINLFKLPHLSALEKLEVLDLSGCCSFTLLEATSFEKMPQLRILNLSRTKIEFLPAFYIPSNLSHLLLESCFNLKMLPSLEELLKLQELNLCGTTSLGEINAHFLERMIHLEILNLSSTKLTELPLMTELVKLKQLILRGCSLLKSVPHLEMLTELQILDLSGTTIQCLPPLVTYSKLRQLLLKECTQLQELLSLESLSHLEVLDLSGTRLKKFPYEISKLAHLKQLGLPNLQSMQEIDWGKIRYLPEEVNWDQCGALNFNHSNIGVQSRKPSICVMGTKFFQFLEKYPLVWKKNFKQFHFSVFPPRKLGEDKKIGFFENIYFKGVHSQLRYFYVPKDDERFVELHGSLSLPGDFASVLKHAKYLSLIDNKYIHCLSFLLIDSMIEVKGCWIERCSNMESILLEEKIGAKAIRNLEFLWLSNLPILKSLYGGNMQNIGFKNLKRLHLDGCPMLEYVFSSSPSQLPENLEILDVKFCDRLETLFQCETESRCALPMLRTLRLLELPELKSIGTKLPSQLTPKISSCPKLELCREISRSDSSFEFLTDVDKGQ